jgi:hypothetical protein
MDESEIPPKLVADAEQTQKQHTKTQAIPRRSCHKWDDDDDDDGYNDA